MEDGSITKVLARHEVHTGDVFFLPAGRVHAICSGILLAEVQQSSDITYRLFDYNRLGLDGRPRELHTDLAVDAVDRQVYDDYRTHYTPKRNSAVPIVDCRYFTTNVIELDGAVRRDLKRRQSFVVYMCMSGRCRIRVHDMGDHPLGENRLIELVAGNSCLIPACIADVDIVSTSTIDMTRLLEVYVSY